MKMTDLELMKAKEQLRALIDSYATLGDEKKLTEQIALLADDVTYTVYMNGMQVAQTKGADKILAEFTGHASRVKTYFTLNGQHAVEVNGNSASGVSFTQIKMIREHSGKDVITDYSVKYIDEYVLENGKWLIKDRVGHFVIIDQRELLQAKH